MPSAVETRMIIHLDILASHLFKNKLECGKDRVGVGVGTKEGQG